MRQPPHQRRLARCLHPRQCCRSWPLTGSSVPSGGGPCPSLAAVTFLVFCWLFHRHARSARQVSRTDWGPATGRFRWRTRTGLPAAGLRQHTGRNLNETIIRHGCARYGGECRSLAPQRPLFLASGAVGRSMRCLHRARMRAEIFLPPAMTDAATRTPGTSVSNPSAINRTNVSCAPTATP